MIKKIIGVHVANKLCNTASRLRNKDIVVSCPNHSGHCTANVQEDEPIGQENKWNETVAKQITQDLDIAYYTGDGDSKGHVGVDKSQNMPVFHLKDLRHLANSIKREIYKASFSKNMLQGHTKSNLKSRFALSVKARCLGELKGAHKHYRGNMFKIKANIPNTIDAIILCFKGYCGVACVKHSFVCRGIHSRAKYFLPQNVRVKMTETDEILLYRCINLLLGPENLQKTKLLTSTQKCEAVNRSYQAVTQKATTFSRNHRGRIHGQVHKLNHGFANSAHD